MPYTETHPLALRTKAYLPPHLGDQLRVCAADEITSTNTVLKEYAVSALNNGTPICPTLLLARRQSHGRGRLGRTFHSPDGTGLYMSLLLTPTLPPAEALTLTTAAAAAAAEAAEDIRRRYVPAAQERIGIKWVNDLYLGNKKICGILAEAALSPRAETLSWAVIGIGVNLLPPQGGFPEDLTGVAGTMFSPDCLLDTDGVTAALCAGIVSRLMLYLDAAQRAVVLDIYRRRSVLDGRRVTVRPAGSLGGAEIPAVALGIDDSFGLRVRYEDGCEAVLSSGEVVLCEGQGIAAVQTARASVHLL